MPGIDMSDCFVLVGAGDIHRILRAVHAGEIVACGGRSRAGALPLVFSVGPTYLDRPVFGPRCDVKSWTKFILEKFE